MTTRNYRLIADVICIARRPYASCNFKKAEKTVALGCLSYLTVLFANRLEHENPRFDCVKFCEAAGSLEEAKEG